MGTPDPRLAADVLAGMRDIPDFPEPGVVFKDFTPLLLDRALRDGVMRRDHLPRVGAAPPTWLPSVSGSSTFGRLLCDSRLTRPVRTRLPESRRIDRPPALSQPEEQVSCRIHKGTFAAVFPAAPCSPQKNKKG